MSKLDTILNKNENIDLTLSYSRISDFSRNGPKALVRPSNPDGEGLRFGSLSDDLLLDKVMNNNTFKQKYYLFDGNKPTATLGELCDIIVKNYDKLPDVETVLKIVRHNAFWSGVKVEETLIKKFNTDEFWNYLNIMFKVQNRIIVTSNDYNDALECVNLLLNHKHTYKLFNNEFENHYQYKFNFSYKGFNLRGIIDKLSIDHTNKIVYMEDIKTSSSKCEEFVKSFIKYCYYFQESVYSLAFEQICKELNLKNYTLAPFKFIVIGRYEKVPHVFEVSEKWHNAALNGFKTKSGYKYKGLNENLDIIYYHWKNKLYEFNKEVYEQNGSLILNDDFIEVN